MENIDYTDFTTLLTILLYKGLCYYTDQLKGCSTQGKRLRTSWVEQISTTEHLRMEIYIL